MATNVSNMWGPAAQATIIPVIADLWRQYYQPRKQGAAYNPTLLNSTQKALDPYKNYFTPENWSAIAKLQGANLTAADIQSRYLNEKFDYTGTLATWTADDQRNYRANNSSNPYVAQYIAAYNKAVTDKAAYVDPVTGSGVMIDAGWKKDVADAASALETAQANKKTADTNLTDASSTSALARSSKLTADSNLSYASSLLDIDNTAYASAVTALSVVNNASVLAAQKVSTDSSNLSSYSSIAVANSLLIDPLAIAKESAIKDAQAAASNLSSVSVQSSTALDAYNKLLGEYNAASTLLQTNQTAAASALSTLSNASSLSYAAAQKAAQ